MGGWADGRTGGRADGRTGRLKCRCTDYGLCLQFVNCELFVCFMAGVASYNNDATEEKNEADRNLPQGATIHSL